MQDLIVFDLDNLVKNLSKIQENTTIVCLGVEKCEIDALLQDAGYLAVESIDLSKYSEIATSITRNYIVEHITKLMSYTKKEEIHGDRNGLNLWYMLAISEKSPMRGNLHQRLFYISQLSQLFAENRFRQINFYVQDRFISNIFESIQSNNSKQIKMTLLYFAHSLRYVYQTLSIRLLRKMTRTFRVFESTPILIFSLFPYWWINAETSLARDRFFPKIPQELKLKIGYISWLTTSPSDYLRIFMRNKVPAEYRPFIVLQDFACFSDLFSLLKFRRIRELSQFRKSVSTANLPKFHNANINEIVADEVAYSISSGDLQLSTLVYISLKKYLVDHDTKKIIFRYECQPIDRAIVFASKGKTQTVGFWHSSMSLCDNYTSFHFPFNYLSKMKEIELINHGFPNRMLLSNLFCKESLSKIGYNSDLTSICGPIRHIEEIEIAKTLQKNSKSRTTNFVGVALSSEPQSAKFLFQAITEISKIDPELVFKVKLHPAYEVSANLIEELRFFLGEERLRIVPSNENHLISFSECSAIILGGTQLAFEAMLIGVVPIVFQPKNRYVATNFEPFNNSCFIVSSLDEILVSIRKILLHSPEVLKMKDNWSKAIVHQFGHNFNFSWEIFLEELKKL